MESRLLSSLFCLVKKLANPNLFRMVPFHALFD